MNWGKRGRREGGRGKETLLTSSLQPHFFILLGSVMSSWQALAKNALERENGKTDTFHNPPKWNADHISSTMVPMIWTVALHFTFCVDGLHWNVVMVSIGQHRILAIEQFFINLFERLWRGFADVTHHAWPPHYWRIASMLPIRTFGQPALGPSVGG